MGSGSGAYTHRMYGSNKSFYSENASSPEEQVGLKLN